MSLGAPNSGDTARGETIVPKRRWVTPVLRKQDVAETTQMQNTTNDDGTALC